MGSQTETTRQRAKIQHQCSWCWQPILAGLYYMRYRYYSHGDVGTVKMHPECHNAMLEAAKEEGEWIEWTPGQERPPELKEAP